MKQTQDWNQNEEIQMDQNGNSVIPKKKNTRYCSECGKVISNSFTTCPFCGASVQATDNRNKWDLYPLMIVLAVLFPIVGLVLGIYGLATKKEGSAVLLIISLVLIIVQFAFASLVFIPLLRDSVTGTFTPVPQIPEIMIP